MFRWILRQNFRERDVTIRWVESSRRIEPEVERVIEDAWMAMYARCGNKLFDGTVARCESMEVKSDHLTICLSKSSYKVVVGTNISHPEFVDRFGRDVMANMFGVSTAVISADDFLVMGRRNSTVAFYPNHVHPFAGNLEANNAVNLFDEARRELREEIGFLGTDIASIEMAGIVEDNRLKHPEAIFIARSTRARDEIITRIDPDEHSGAWAKSIHALNINIDDLTPVARAVVLLLESQK